MTRRRLVWVGVVMCAALAVCLTAWMSFVRPGKVRLANHRGIRAGMTLAEVERVLGGPPGDYSSDPQPTDSYLATTRAGWGVRWETWVSDEGVVTVHLNDEGRVTDWGHAGAGLTSPGFFDRLRAWLGW